MKRSLFAVQISHSASRYYCRKLQPNFVSLRRGYLLRVLCVFVVTSLHAAPRITCDSPKFDFGTVIGQEKIKREFILQNRGDSPLKIAKIKNCCGVTSSITPMEIPPGSNAVCKVIFTTKNRYGKQNKQVLIATNDRKKPYFELKMIGTLLRQVEFKPRLIRLNTLFPDSEITQTITATNLLEKAVELRSVKTTIKGINVEVVESNDRDWRIGLSALESLPVGKLNGQIHLNFSSGTMKVPVIGTVKPVIQVVPEQIQFSARSSKPTDRLIMLRSGDGRPFKIRSAKLAAGEGSVDVKKLADDRWQCRISLVPSRIPPKTFLLIETSIPSASEIRIPIN